jgi:hypothetical protein
MDKIKKVLKEKSWAIYLGGSLSLLNIYCLDWKWWAIVIPTIILNVIFNNNNK